jgi:hypothetical protein
MPAGWSIATCSLIDTASIGTPPSAAERTVSPASTPSPPLYVGSASASAISIEKYAIWVAVAMGTMRNSG